MRVVIHLSHFYNWESVPKDVVVTEQDIAAGKVMPSRDGGYRMKVVRGPTEHFLHIDERTLIEKIVEEKSDIRKAGRTLTRKQAVSQLIMDQIAPNQFEMDWITKFEVEDDGPDEALFREMIGQHAKADHGRRLGRKNIPPDHVDDHAAKYLESADAAAHVDHLHQHFGVKK